jgi:ribosomal protein L37E
MRNQQDSPTEVARRAFSWRRSSLHEIHRAIGRARRRPKSAIRVVYTALPERKTWYECASCGSEAYREDSRGKHCRLCGSPAVQREWVRPDITQAEERARQRRAQFTWVGSGPGGRPTRYAEVTNAHPWKPLPDGEYRIVRKTRTPD